MAIELILGDCLEKMKDIPDNSIDLILTDPPRQVITVFILANHKAVGILCL